MTKKYIIASILAGVLLSGGFTYALTSENSGSGTLIITPVDNNVQAEVKAEGSVTASPDTKLDTKIDANVDADDQRLLPTVNKATDDESSERVLPTVNKKNIEAKVTVRGWDAEKKDAVEGMIKFEVKKNLDINSVDVSEDAMTINYSTPAKLFGFITWNMRINVVTDAQAKVKVHFPWYRFLVASEFSHAEEKLNAVFQNNQTDLEFLKAKASQDRQVEIFIKISAELHEMSKSIIANIKA